MKLPAILTSDLHLTANPEDAHRWGLFPWLARECESERAETLVVLGDLTDAKDRHPAELVNRVVRSVQMLRERVGRVIILKGNHDLLKDGHTFFQFLDALDGVEVISRPTEDVIVGGAACVFLPHTRTPAADWRDSDFSHFDYLFMHQTVTGARAGNGQGLTGESLPALNAGKVYSGDVHVPQTVGPVEYVGSPYHVHFGDAFEPRCIAIDRDRRAFDLRFPTVRRLMLDVSGEEGVQQVVRLSDGDQVKLRVHLSESDRHRWRELRRLYETACSDAGVMLCGLELRVAKSRLRVAAGDRPAAMFGPGEAVLEFVEGDGLGGELLDAGLECLEGGR